MSSIGVELTGRNPEPSRACNGSNAARGAEGVTTRAKGNCGSTSARPERDDIVWTAWRHAEVGHKQAGDNSFDEQLDITPQSVITAAQYNIKQAAISVSMSGLEELQNSGEEEIINLLESRIENAEGSFINNLSSDIYSAGTADGGLQINGLQALVSDAGTGTVGGIDSGTWTFWQNQTFSFASNSLVPSAATIQTAMNRMYFATLRNRDTTDLIVADNIYFRYYIESLQAHQRFTNEGLKNAGFMNVKFFNADVVLDGGYGGDAPASHMYFLQTKYILYRPHRKREMVPLDPKRFSVNQDAFVVLIGWAGNMTARNRQLQAVIVA